MIGEAPRLVLRRLRAEGWKRSEFIEIFAWKDVEALAAARKSPEVLTLWEALEQFCEAHEGRPAAEFPHYEAL